MPAALPLSSRVHKTGYCWSTPKCRKACLRYAFVEGPKIARIQRSNNSHIAWKKDDQQYPGVIFIVPSVGTTGMCICCRTPKGIRQDVASHTHHLSLSRRGQ